MPPADKGRRPDVGRDRGAEGVGDAAVTGDCLVPAAGGTTGGRARAGARNAVPCVLALAGLLVAGAERRATGVELEEADRAGEALAAGDGPPDEGVDGALVLRVGVGDSARAGAAAMAGKTSQSELSSLRSRRSPGVFRFRCCIRERLISQRPLARVTETEVLPAWYACSILAATGAP